MNEIKCDYISNIMLDVGIFQEEDVNEEEGEDLDDEEEYDEEEEEEDQRMSKKPRHGGFILEEAGLNQW